MMSKLPHGCFTSDRMLRSALVCVTSFDDVMIVAFFSTCMNREERARGEEREGGRERERARVSGSVRACVSE